MGETRFFAVFVCVNKIIFHRSHTLHQIQTEAVADLHSAEICQARNMTLRVWLVAKQTVVQVLDRHGHSVSCPCEIGGIERQSTVFEIDGGLAEFTDAMRM